MGSGTVQLFRADAYRPRVLAGQLASRLASESRRIYLLPAKHLHACCVALTHAAACCPAASKPAWTAAPPPISPHSAPVPPRPPPLCPVPFSRPFAATLCRRSCFVSWPRCFAPCLCPGPSPGTAKLDRMMQKSLMPICFAIWLLKYTGIILLLLNYINAD